MFDLRAIMTDFFFSNANDAEALSPAKPISGATTCGEQISPTAKEIEDALQKDERPTSPHHVAAGVRMLNAIVRDLDQSYLWPLDPLGVPNCPSAGWDFEMGLWRTDTQEETHPELVGEGGRTRRWCWLQKPGPVVIHLRSLAKATTESAPLLM